MKIDKSNTISKEQIEEWKNEYGHIYRTFLDGNPIIWRRLKRKEYEEITISTADDELDLNEDEEDTPDVARKRTARMYNRQNMIAQAAIIYPENAMDLLNNYALAITNISDDVMAISGFDMPKSEEL